MPGGLTHRFSAVVTGRTRTWRHGAVIKLRPRPDILVVALIARLGGLNVVGRFIGCGALTRMPVTLVTPGWCAAQDPVNMAVTTIYVNVRPEKRKPG